MNQAVRHILTLSCVYCMTAVAAFADEGDEDAADLIDDWIGLAESGSRILLYLASAVGIGMVAWSIFRMATDDDTEDKWKHVGGIAVGSLLTIFGVIVGLFSKMFVPG